jgi:hypothetical protein
MTTLTRIISTQLQFPNGSLTSSSELKRLTVPHYIFQEINYVLFAPEVQQACWKADLDHDSGILEISGVVKVGRSRVRDTCGVR